jgi:TonB family protein
MAHQPMSRPDPFADSENDEPLFALENDPKELDVHHLAAKLADHMEGASPADLALDLVLNEIVQQARLATTATGAAIALVRNGEMVCRASSGIGAPDLGTRLDTRIGLSGACLRTKQVQRCDNTETDPRVDGAAMLEFDVRSVLIVPIISGQDVVGVFEILSPRQKAFGDRDVLTLEALSRRIVRNLDRIAAPPEPATPVVIPPAVVVVPDEVRAAPEAALFSTIVPTAESQPAYRDYWTTVLTAVVIALALLLGWMVGYSGWQRAMASRAVADAKKPTASASRAAGEGQAREKEKLAANPTRAKSGNEGPAPGGLVVTQNGKVIFEMPSDQTAASTIKAAGGADSGNTMTLAPEVADSYVLRRVEPQFPDAAKQSQAIGPVILEVRVAKDGTVKQANLVSGDALLVSAAMAAVRQWKYQPYESDGNPQEFLTRVTVNFKTP